MAFFSGTPVDSLAIELRADGRKLIADVNSAMAAVEKRVNKIGQGLVSAGSTITRRVSAPLAAMSTGVLKVAGDFEEAMNTVNSHSRATEEQFGKLREIAMSIGGDKGIPGTAKEAAAAMDMLARNGVSAGNLLDKGITASVLRLAKATGGEASLASDIATDAALMFGLGMDKVGKIADGVLATTLKSKIAIDDYALALGQGGGGARSAGLKLEDFNGIMAATAGMFKSGAAAGTSFNQFVSKLAGTTKKQSAEQKRLNLNFFDGAGNMKSVVEIAGMLDDALSGLSDKQRLISMEKMFGVKAGRTALGLSLQGAEGMQAIMDEMSGIGLEEALRKRQRGLNHQIGIVKKAFANLFIKIGDTGMLENATKVVTKLSDSLFKLADANPALLKLISTVAMVGAVVGPAVMGLGFFVMALSSLSGVLPILSIIGAGASVIGLLAREFNLGATAASLFERTQARLGSAFNRVKTFVMGVVASLGEGTKAGSVIRNTWDTLTVSVLGLAEPLQSLWESFKALVVAVDSALEPLGGFQHIITALVTVLTTGFIAALIAVIETFKLVVKGITHIIDGWKLLFTEWDKVTGAIKILTQQLVDGVVAKFNQLKAKIEGLIKPIRDLGGSFKWLYEKVVGSSWVPAMVSGIIREGVKLEKGFFQPVTKSIAKQAVAWEEGTEKTIKSVKKAAKEIKSYSDKTLDGLNNRLEVLNEKLQKLRIGSSDFTKVQEQITANEEKINEALYGPREDRKQFNLDVAASQMSILMNRATQFTDHLIDGTMKFKDAFKETLIGIGRDLAKLSVEKAFGAVLNSVNSAGGWGAVLQGVGSLLGFAEGGRPQPGRPAVVGEKGPEVWVPDEAGTIFPNGFQPAVATMQAPAGPVVHQHFHGGVTRRELASIKGQWQSETVSLVSAAYNKGGSFRRSMK